MLQKNSRNTLNRNCYFSRAFLLYNVLDVSYAGSVAASRTLVSSWTGEGTLVETGIGILTHSELGMRRHRPTRMFHRQSMTDTRLRRSRAFMIRGTA